MPASDHELSDPQATPPGLMLAVTAEGLYLANLLLLPGLAFAVLGLLFLRRQGAPALAAAHLAQTFSASLWAGVLLVLVNVLILLLGGYEGAHTWALLITYFTICHSGLVVLGILGLAKALAGQCWRFPLVGRALPPGCGES